MTEWLSVGTLVEFGGEVGYIKEVCRDKAFDRPYGYLVHIFSLGVARYASGYNSIVAI